MVGRAAERPFFKIRAAGRFPPTVVSGHHKGRWSLRSRDGQGDGSRKGRQLRNAGGETRRATPCVDGQRELIETINDLSRSLVRRAPRSEGTEWNGLMMAVRRYGVQLCIFSPRLNIDAVKKN